MSSEERRVSQSPVMLERVKLYWPVRLTPGGGWTTRCGWRSGLYIQTRLPGCRRCCSGRREVSRRGGGLGEQGVEGLGEEFRLVEGGDSYG